MDPVYDEEVSKLLAELNEQREKISGAVEEVQAVRESATTKNKMIKATVDGQGRLTEVVLRGDRWRDLSPKELGAAIVEAVTGAQEKAHKNVTELAAAMAPEGMNIPELFSGKPDIEALFPDVEKMWRSFNE
ncbi:YbaB/EbfC family nucleoid-associated protein [Saccharopolyspora shandongensis]|uniref:YbaB/EbfC family nucleoid-associated protein n=1 Tax=Saccharopolyspora shandongensis TaxID=418495 RepID=UPI0033EB163D